MKGWFKLGRQWCENHPLDVTCQVPTYQCTLPFLFKGVSLWISQYIGL